MGRRGDRQCCGRRGPASPLLCVLRRRRRRRPLGGSRRRQPGGAACNTLGCRHSDRRTPLCVPEGGRRGGAHCSAGLARALPRVLARPAGGAVRPPPCHRRARPADSHAGTLSFAGAGHQRGPQGQGGCRNGRPALPSNDGWQANGPPPPNQSPTHRSLPPTSAPARCSPPTCQACSSDFGSCNPWP